MTTREREFTPRLDRQISREITETDTATIPGGTTYTFATAFPSSGSLSAGQWRRDSDTMLSVALEATGGGGFPEDLPTILAGVQVWWDSESPTTLTLESTAILRDPFTFQPIGISLTFGATLPASGTELNIRLPGGAFLVHVSHTRTIQIWAARLDFSGRTSPR